MAARAKLRGRFLRGHAIQFFVKARVTAPHQLSSSFSPTYPSSRANSREKVYIPLHTKFFPTRETHVRGFFRVTANCYGRYNERLLIFIIVQNVSEILHFSRNIKIKKLWLSQDTTANIA